MKKWKRKPRSKRLLNVVANIKKVKRERAVIVSERAELEAKIKKGLKYRINGLDTTPWWMSTPQAVKRSVQYYRRQNDEQS